MKGNQENKKIDIKKVGLALILVLAFSVILAPYLLTRETIFPSFLGLGEVGDVIGGTTAPIVGLVAAILVYYALLEQIKANKIISDQFLEQKKITHRQNFEQTFFSMLNIHHDIVNNIEYNPSNLALKIARSPRDLIEMGKTDSELKKRIANFRDNTSSKKDIIKGRDFFQFSLEILADGIFIADKIGGLAHDSQFSQFKNLQTGVPFNSFFNEVYKKCFHQFDTNLGHYYRNLYRIIKMIDREKFSEDEKEDYEIKYFYTSIVRSQLSDYEIQWMFFNSIFDYGKNFKPLIERYSLLKILKWNPDETIIKFKVLYDNTAFEKIKWKENEVL